MVWIGHNSMDLLVRSHGDASCNGRNFMTLLVRAHSGASGNGNFMNFLVRFRGGASVYN